MFRFVLKNERGYYAGSSWNHVQIDTPDFTALISEARLFSARVRGGEIEWEGLPPDARGCEWEIVPVMLAEVRP